MGEVDEKEIERLERDVEEARREVERLVDKVGRLSERYRVTGVVAERVDLESQLSTTNEQLVDGRARFEKLRAVLLGRLLRPLDFSEQWRTFTRLREAGAKKGFVAATVLSGSQERGLYWLFGRLARTLKRGSEDPEKFRHDFQTLSVQHHAGAIVAKLGRMVGDPTACKPRDLTSRLVPWRAHRDLILVFDHVERLPPAALTELVEMIWRPLVLDARQSSEGRSVKWLAAFFLFHGDVPSVSDPSPWCTDLNEAWTAEQPVVLPPLSDLDESAIVNWVDRHFESLTDTIRHRDYPKTLLAGAANTEDVFMKICQEGWQSDWLHFHDEWSRP